MIGGGRESDSCRARESYPTLYANFMKKRCGPRSAEPDPMKPSPLKPTNKEVAQFRP